LTTVGLDPRRLKLTWIGASEGNEFAETVNELVRDIKALGPSEAASLGAM
jgi:coenzyme F420-reducing hydrogenase delta subunit